MLGVASDEILNIAQSFWHRLNLSPPRMIEKAKSRIPERLDLGPLLNVRFSRHLKCTPHPMKVCSAFRAYGARFLSQLP
jgi:hypothetical protein